MRNNGASRLTGKCDSLCVNTEYVLMCSTRPIEFVKKSAYPDDSDEEESIVGKMPPSESEEDE